jgi:hypothetical protein
LGFVPLKVTTRAEPLGKEHDDEDSLRGPGAVKSGLIWVFGLFRAISAMGNCRVAACFLQVRPFFKNASKNSEPFPDCCGHCWQERLQTVQSEQFVVDFSQHGRQLVRMAGKSRAKWFLRSVDSQPEKLVQVNSKIAQENTRL